MDWCLSLKPEHWDAIVSGQKRYELRRRLPGVSAGDTIWVYVIRPVKAVCGGFRAADILRAESADELWDVVRGGVPTTDPDAFRAYFRGASQHTAIAVSDVQVMEPTPPWFHPPQGVIRCPSKG